MKAILPYITVFLLAVAGILAYIFKGRDLEALDERRRNLEARRGVYERTEADTRRAEERLARKIKEIDDKLAETPPRPDSASGAASRLRDLMGWKPRSTDED